VSVCATYSYKFLCFCAGLFSDDGCKGNVLPLPFCACHAIFVVFALCLCLANKIINQSINQKIGTYTAKIQTASSTNWRAYGIAFSEIE